MTYLGLFFLMTQAYAGVDVAVKNKTVIEFDIYKDFRPYVANEITIGRSGFVLEDPNGVITLNQNKLTAGIKYPTGEWITLDPHWYVQHRRDTKWSLQHGLALRIDAIF